MTSSFREPEMNKFGYELEVVNQYGNVFDPHPIIGDPDGHHVRLVWATPHIDDLMLYMAKVSNPGKQTDPSPNLIRYLIDNNHWSPFEMCNIAFEVNTTRTIGRQFIRHWTMRVQEFSQRYADPTALGDPIFSKARLQDATNRQASIETEDNGLQAWWDAVQDDTWARATKNYQEAIRKGMAKELARNLLPEGLTPTRLYFNAQIRTILHLCNLRSKKGGAQNEAVMIAQGVEQLLLQQAPDTHNAYLQWRGLAPQ